MARPEFAAHSHAVMRLLAIGMFVNCLAQVALALLQSSGRPDLGARVHLAEFPFYLLALWLLIGGHGIQGVAVAWLGRAGVDAIAMIVMARRRLARGRLRRAVALLAGGGGVVVMTAGLPAAGARSAVGVRLGGAGRLRVPRLAPVRSPACRRCARAGRRERLRCGRARRVAHAPGAGLPGVRGAGTTLHDGLEDRLFGVPGRWRMVRCSGNTCGTLWLDPAPLPATWRSPTSATTRTSPRRARPQAVRALARWVKEGHYAARFGYAVRGAAKRLAALALAARPGLADALDDLILRLPPCPGGRVLDAGCGEGRTLEQLRDLGWQVEGVDFDRGAVLGAAARGIPVRLGTLEDQRYPDGAFDAVVHRHVLEHVPDPAGFLAECRRLLKPGGRLALVTPNAASLGHARFGAALAGARAPAPPAGVHAGLPAAGRRGRAACG